MERVHVERHPQRGDPVQDGSVDGIVEEPRTGTPQDQDAAQTEVGHGAVELAAHLVTALGRTTDEAEVAANELIGLVIHPTLPRLLFGIEPLADELPEEAHLAADVDLDRISRLVRIVLPPSPAA